VAGEFVPLADFLRAPASSAARDAGACDHGVARVPPDVIADSGADVAERLGVADEVDVVAAVREARLFRARLADAFDDAAARLLRELASDVLARELRLAPCDVAAIVRRIGERAPIVRVRVAVCDAPALAAVSFSREYGAVVVVEDPALAGGDAVVELAGGALDARLGVRLAVVLEAFA